MAESVKGSVLFQCALVVFPIITALSLDCKIPSLFRCGTLIGRAKQDFFSAGAEVLAN